jgi:benzodiazapine receptor
MDGWDLSALAIAVGVALAMAMAGTVLSGDALRTWYPTLRHPSWEPPIWGWVVIGLVAYVLEGIVLYRLLTVVTDDAERAVAILALLVVMLANELWNAVLFRMRSPRAAFFSLLAFLGLVLGLEAILAMVDPTSAFILLPYAVWVAAYDVQWSYRLWRINST